MKRIDAWPWLVVAGGSGVLLVVLTAALMARQERQPVAPLQEVEAAPLGSSFAPGFGRLDELVPFAGGVAPVPDVVVPASEHAPEFHGGDWVAAQNPQSWTLQVLAVRDEQSVKRFLAGRTDRADFSYFLFPHDGVNWYVVTLGSFPTRELALGVGESRGVVTGQGQGFPRRLDVYQAALRPGAAAAPAGPTPSVPVPAAPAPSAAAPAGAAPAVTPESVPQQDPFQP